VAEAVILDIDGTLVDTNYQHVIAWDRALARHGAHVELWRIHRHIGMGGDQLVAGLAGDEVEERSGDGIRDAESDLYADLIGEVRVIDGALELLDALAERETKVVLASSASSDEVEHYVDMLGARDQVEWTTSGDVENTKPQPDLIEAALEKAGTRDAFLVGDTVWDVKAAKRAGIDTVGVLTGGVSEAELSEAGAFAVYESAMSLVEDLDSALSR
jgi:HAD superfamily hydrolase (TIGR01509 family)